MEWSFASKDAINAKQLKAEVMSALYEQASEGSDLAAAELIYGELIGNAVRHAPGRVTVALTWDAPYPELMVHDEHDAFPLKAELPDDIYAESGRGLFIVRSLARDLRIRDIAGDGCKVSAILPVRRVTRGQPLR